MSTHGMRALCDAPSLPFGWLMGRTPGASFDTKLSCISKHSRVLAIYSYTQTVGDVPPKILTINRSNITSYDIRVLGTATQWTKAETLPDGTFQVYLNSSDKDDRNALNVTSTLVGVASDFRNGCTCLNGTRVLNSMSKYTSLKA